MGRIAVLPPALANQIAAGEVVERPASVVKELVENAVDAGATRVTVSLRAGGCDGIVVRDDGEGMSRDDAVLSFARHATSKIARVDDLVGISSFGFRGEALASIAAAAEVELLTRRADEDIGTRVRARGGAVVDVMDAGSAPGTLVDVRDLFGTLPARRKFLKRPATEFGHAAEFINRMALGVPRVGFTLAHDKREVLSFPPVASPADRLIQVVGRECAPSMVHLDARIAAMSVVAYLGRPEHSLSSARLVLTYVGGRFVRDRVLTRAVLDGYDTLLMRGRYPVAVVFLELARGEMDVNVHPTKAEVRFRDPGLVHEFVAGGIAARLRDALGCRAESLSADVVRTDGQVGAAGGWMAGRTAVEKEPLPGAAWTNRVRFDLRSKTRADNSAHDWELRFGEGEPTYRSEAGDPRGRAGRLDAAVDPEPPCTGRSPDLPQAGFFASLRVLGQVLDGYLACASNRGLVLIDQHAAHERVRFEEVRTQLASGGVPMQRLLAPETLRLGVREVQALGDAGDALGRLGFEGEPFGEDVYLLRAVPAILVDTDCAAVLRDVAADLTEIGASRRVEEVVEALLASVACHSAIRLGRRLNQAEAEALLRAMDEVVFSGYCPHGRPAVVELDAGALERMFKR